MLCCCRRKEIGAPSVLLERGALAMLLCHIEGDPCIALMENCGLVLLQHNIVLTEIIGPTSTPRVGLATPCIEGDAIMGP
jgi:hypothetical protein